jgi:ABC-2 type transport system ATP-binding protein
MTIAIDAGSRRELRPQAPTPFARVSHDFAERLERLPAQFFARPKSTAPALSVENLMKRFGSTTVVADVSFTIPVGATLGLLGSNGAGKTTTIGMIMGLVTPSKGRAVVLGHDMTRAPHEILHRVNFISPYVAMPAKLTVRQNLFVFGRLYGVAELKRRIEELAEQFGIADLLDRIVGSLSAGQKTRAALVKALLNEPQLLLLDEPTASLDPESAAWIRELLDDYRRRHGAALLLASHNMQEVEQLCDSVVILHQGRLVERGAPRQLMEDYDCDDLFEAFLEVCWRQSSRRDLGASYF